MTATTTFTAERQRAAQRAARTAVLLDANRLAARGRLLLSELRERRRSQARPVLRIDVTPLGAAAPTFLEYR